MALRWSGKVLIRIRYRDAGDYAGRICLDGGQGWSFSGIKPPAVGFGPGIAYDSPVAYDETAKAALKFGSYFSTRDRGPDMAGMPDAEIADEIATQAEFNPDTGEAVVRRKPR